MQEIAVCLADWEHECCGDARAVGDAVSMKVFCHDGQFVEQRHDYDNEISIQVISGTITGIAWAPAILERVDEVSRTIAGYGPPVPVQSTEFEPDANAWKYVFMVATDDALPALD